MDIVNNHYISTEFLDLGLQNLDLYYQCTSNIHKQKPLLIKLM